MLPNRFIEFYSAGQGRRLPGKSHFVNMRLDRMNYRSAVVPGPIFLNLLENQPDGLPLSDGAKKSAVRQGMLTALILKMIHLREKR